MFTLFGGKPATFLDIGGGASDESIKKALNLVLNYPPVKVVFLNVLGGITRADDVARGVIAALEDNKWDVNEVYKQNGKLEKIRFNEEHTCIAIINEEGKESIIMENELNI